MGSSSPDCRTCLLLVAGGVVLSGASPVDRYTWALEVAIVVGVALLLVALRRRFVPSRGLRLLLLAYAAVMLVGAHWTYGHAPPGEWARELLDLERNPYDRFGHVLQGLVPVLVAREWLGPRARPGLLLAAGLAPVLLFELLEPLAAALAPAGVDFVQAQGDPRDTLWDVVCAGAGVSVGLVHTIRTGSGQPQLDQGARLES